MNLGRIVQFFLFRWYPHRPFGAKTYFSTFFYEIFQFSRESANRSDFGENRAQNNSRKWWKKTKSTERNLENHKNVRFIRVQRLRARKKNCIRQKEQFNRFVEKFSKKIELFRFFKKIVDFTTHSCFHFAIPQIGFIHKNLTEKNQFGLCEMNLWSGEHQTKN